MSIFLTGRPNCYYLVPLPSYIAGAVFLIISYQMKILDKLEKIYPEGKKAK
ncbi:MAG: hypothetical protein N3F05_04845 [Candidatus Diapherotrites archaeon]|nr:hypothetical protein [Candidatus Diapherotrites archaeon]